jgi:hypothetical protein
MLEVFSSWPDLTEQLISHLDVDYFTEGSSFVQNSTGFAGYMFCWMLSLKHDHCSLGPLTRKKVLNMDKKF